MNANAALSRAAVDTGVEAALALAGDLATADVVAGLRYVTGSLAPRLARTGEELDNVLAALEGGFVPAGPSGAPTRGMAHVLPTGRHFYSVDPKSLPSPIAFEVGGELACALLDRYLELEGAYPETVGIVVWGTAAMRTHGVSQSLFPVLQRADRTAESRARSGPVPACGSRTDTSHSAAASDGNRGGSSR